MAQKRRPPAVERAGEEPVVLVRYFAGAAAAAGCQEEKVPLPVDGAPLAELLAVLGERHGGRLPAVLAACSFLLDEVAVRSPGRVVLPGSMLDVLPPFAGG